MTLQEAKLILMTNTDCTEPTLWEAYELVYGRKHRCDPDLPQDEKDAAAERRYKNTPQEFDPAEWPIAEFEVNVTGLDLEHVPFAMNPTYWATEETADFLAGLLNAKKVWKDGPKNAFTWPGAWALVWGTGDERNAGKIAELYNRKRQEFQDHIDRWNLNVGDNNQTDDPQTRTPDILVLQVLELETKTDLDGDGFANKVPVEPPKKKRK